MFEKEMRNLMKIYWELICAFMRIGAFTFGGGYAMLPLIQKEIVDKKRWATEEEIMDYYAVSQCTPGIIMVNTATFIGYYLKGIPGAIVATLSVVTPSIVIISLIASILTTYSSLAIVQHALAGIRVAVCVLVLNAVIKLWKNGIKDAYGIIIFAIVLAVVSFTSISTVIIVILSAVAGLIYTTLKQRGQVK